LKNAPLALPKVSEIDVVRHFTNLSQKSYGVDNGMYPLGSCTMKYNPKRNDIAANLSGFKDAHPAQPKQTLLGLWELMYNLQNHLAEITGMHAISLVPSAGAQGEQAGLLIIKKYFQKQNENRTTILVADSAHGTNPASAAMAGFKINIVETGSDGLLSVDDLKNKLTKDVAALMLTNPSTLGLFEKRIQDITHLVHQNGSLLYYDGANLNALMGIVRPGDMGFDVMHVNTHKTFSTPHGGGGPGAGPLGVKEFLAPYLPPPVITLSDNSYNISNGAEPSIGKIRTWFGHIDVLIKAYCYILTLGAHGLKEASEDAVLNANYIRKKLSDVAPTVFLESSMHECLLTIDTKKTSVLDLSLGLIEADFYPPTMLGAGCVYFPPSLTSAMLIEPTETESKENLDRFIDVIKNLITK
jgi:glycine cleavage system protein P-like pyridoxal-binding family